MVRYYSKSNLSLFYAEDVFYFNPLLTAYSSKGSVLIGSSHRFCKGGFMEQLDGSKYFYEMLIIQLLHSVKGFQVLQCNTNNAI